MLPLGNIIRKHGVSFHCYADDTQLYISSQPGETHQIEKRMECIVDMGCNPGVLAKFPPLALVNGLLIISIHLIGSMTLSPLHL